MPCSGRQKLANSRARESVKKSDALKAAPSDRSTCRNDSFPTLDWVCRQAADRLGSSQSAAPARFRKAVVRSCRKHVEGRSILYSFIMETDLRVIQAKLLASCGFCDTCGQLSALIC